QEERRVPLAAEEAVRHEIGIAVDDQTDLVALARGSADRGRRGEHERTSPIAARVVGDLLQVARGRLERALARLRAGHPLAAGSGIWRAPAMTSAEHAFGTSDSSRLARCTV